MNEQISNLVDLGVTISDLAWVSAPNLDFETRLRTTALQIEKWLKSFGEQENQPTPLALEIMNSKLLSERETIAPEETAINASLQTLNPTHSDPEEKTESDLIFIEPTIVQQVEKEPSTEPIDADRIKSDLSKLGSSQQRKLFTWMLTQRHGATFNELRTVDGAWTDRNSVSDEGINKKLKLIRDALPKSRWCFEISLKGREFIWEVFNGDKRY